MPKVIFVTDIHVGARNDHPAIVDIQKKFWLHLVEQMNTMGIFDIICGGDFFDKRTYVTIKSMEFARWLEDLFTVNGITFKTLVGNHDTLYRDTNEMNSLDKFFVNSPSIIVYKDVIELPELNLLAVPWICADNEKEIMEKMATTKMQYCYGHFSIKGFEFHKGTVCDHGLDESVFNRFKSVFSGHFHTRSNRGNITYLGSPYEMSWSDFNDPRGFHVFDSDEGSLQFHQVPLHLFYTIDYVGSPVIYSPVSPGSFQGMFVKVLVKEKGDVYEFDTFIKAIQSQNPADLQIIEQKIDIASQIELSEEEVKTRVKGNAEIINQYIDGLQDISDELKSGVKQELNTLYAEI